jgi:hypothetical protein
VSAFVVASVDEEPAGLLAAVPLARGRMVHGVPVRTGDLPGDPADVRALAVAGVNPPAAPLPALVDLVRRCHQAEIPILGVGTGGSVVLEALAGEEVVRTDAEVRLLVSHPTADAADDPLAEGLPDGHRWLVAGGLPELTAAVPLARQPGGAPLLLRLGAAAYATCLLPQLDAEGVAARLVGLLDGDTKLAGQLTRFIAANNAALVGRWVDGVVGRNEAETPWGRKGPPPVPRPEAYLNPA